MAISRGVGGCSKGWVFVWSPDQIPTWCFFCRVLLALHIGILLPCLLNDVSKTWSAPKPRFTFASMLVHSSGGFWESEHRNMICIDFNPWVICSFMTPLCFAMPVVWRESPSSQTPGNLGEGELALLQSSYPCSTGVTVRTTSRKTGKNGGYIYSVSNRCAYWFI